MSSSKLAKLILEVETTIKHVRERVDIDNRVYEKLNKMYDHLTEEDFCNAECEAKEICDILKYKKGIDKARKEVKHLFTLDEFGEYLLDIEGIDYNRSAIKDIYLSCIMEEDRNQIELGNIGAVEFKRIFIFTDDGEENLLDYVIKVDDVNYYNAKSKERERNLN